MVRPRKNTKPLAMNKNSVGGLICSHLKKTSLYENFQKFPGNKEKQAAGALYKIATLVETLDSKPCTLL